MPVAKSYMNLTQTCEPYMGDNNRWYVKVIMKSGKEKEVRWYSDLEYEKMYPDTTVVKPTDDSIRKALGFQEGYITIFKGDQESNNDWFRLSNARWARYWGWYVVSTEEVPEQLPFGVEPVKLYWNDIAAIDGSGALKPEDKVQAIVDSLLYGESESQFVGQIGERLELILKVDKAIPFDSAYGKTTMHIMHDDCGNEYLWTTGSKTLTVDESLKGMYIGAYVSPNINKEEYQLVQEPMELYQ